MKKKKGLVIGTIVFLLLGVITMLVGFAMTGWSIIDWLNSPYATTCFILLGIGLVILLVILFAGKLFNVGGYDE